MSQTMEQADGMKLLLNNLLPNIIKRLKTLESEVAELKVATAPKPRKPRAKKAEPVATEVKEWKPPYSVSTAQMDTMMEMYQEMTGMSLMAQALSRVGQLCRQDLAPT